MDEHIKTVSLWKYYGWKMYKLIYCLVSKKSDEKEESLYISETDHYFLFRKFEKEPKWNEWKKLEEDEAIEWIIKSGFNLFKIPFLFKEKWENENEIVFKAKNTFVIFDKKKNKIEVLTYGEAAEWFLNNDIEAFKKLDFKIKFENGDIIKFENGEIIKSENGENNKVEVRK